MAGLAAEEVFLGEYGNGGTSDLETATNIAMNMITRYGMSKNGFAQIKDIDDDARKEINELLSNEFKRAKKEIEAHKKVLEKAKEFLLKNKTISQDDFEKLIKNN